MSRITDLVQLGGTGTVVPKAGDNFLSQINVTIGNFKQLLNMVQDIRGITNAPPSHNEPTPQVKIIEKAAPAAAPAQCNTCQVILKLLIAGGYGDTPIGDLIKQIEPHTIKQLGELIKNAGLKT